MSAGHIFFKGRYLHFITLQHMRCGISDLKPPPPHLFCALLTLSLSPAFYLKEAPMTAFKWLQIVRVGLFRWLPGTILLKKSKHTVLISADELFMSGFNALDWICDCECAKLRRQMCKPVCVFKVIRYKRNGRADNIVINGTAMV